DPEKVNVHGGAIALGHPYGMTGARITTTLINGLRFRDATIGPETMCTAGGQGMAMIIERLSRPPHDRRNVGDIAGIEGLHSSNVPDIAGTGAGAGRQAVSSCAA